MTWEKKRVLVTVKAYPEPSKRYGESVCTAGITEDGKWIRLYPIPFEIFRGPQRFSKYDWIEVECRNASSEEKLGRKESHKVRYKTIKVIDRSLSKSPVDWKGRNDVVLRMVSNCVEELPIKFEEDHTSLALIRPRQILDFHKSRELTDEEKEVANHVQMTLGGTQRTPLQQIPHIFKYRFECFKEDCSGHDITCEDWELLEAYRRWDYPTEEILWEKLYQRFYTFMIGRDIHFYMGTHSLYPVWLIIGLYYPPKSA